MSERWNWVLVEVEVEVDDRRDNADEGGGAEGGRGH